MEKNWCDGYSAFAIPSSEFSFWIVCFVLFVSFPCHSAFASEPQKGGPGTAWSKQIKGKGGRGGPQMAKNRNRSCLGSSLRECRVERGGSEGKEGREREREKTLIFSAISRS